MARAEKRRQVKQERKPDPNGLTKKQLQDAADELAELTEIPRKSDPETAFGAMLDQWWGLEHQREGIRVQYERTRELLTRGRQVRPDDLKSQYALVKEELQVVEDQIVKLLDGLDEDLVSQLLSTRHLLPQKGITYGVPDELKERLRQTIEPEEPEHSHNGVAKGMEA